MLPLVCSGHADRPPARRQSTSVKPHYPPSQLGPLLQIGKTNNPAPTKHVSTKLRGHSTQPSRAKQVAGWRLGLNPQPKKIFRRARGALRDGRNHPRRSTTTTKERPCLNPRSHSSRLFNRPDILFESINSNTPPSLIIQNGSPWCSDVSIILIPLLLLLRFSSLPRQISSMSNVSRIGNGYDFFFGTSAHGNIEGETVYDLGDKLSSFFRHARATANIEPNTKKIPTRHSTTRENHGGAGIERERRKQAHTTFHDPKY